MKSSEETLLVSLSTKVFENNLMLKDILEKLNSRELRKEVGISAPPTTMMVLRPAEDEEQLRAMCQMEDLVSSNFN